MRAQPDSGNGRRPDRPVFHSFLMTLKSILFILFLLVGGCQTTGSIEYQLPQGRVALGFSK